MSEANTGRSSGAAFGPGGYLEFEKPIARIEQQIAELVASQETTGRDCSKEIDELREVLVALTKKTYSNLTPWETVLVARHPKRPHSTDYINMFVRDFVELHGDRSFRDDKAMITGFGRIGSHKVMVVGHRKGRDTKEKIECCFGCAHPEGYRKALLKMQMAAKFNLPIVCLIDTPGAYPGIGAEERGPGIRDRLQSYGNAETGCPDRMRGDRRGRQRRRAGHRRGRPRGDVRAFVLQRHLAGRRGGDPVEERLVRGTGGGGPEDDRQGSQGAGHRRRGGVRASGRGPSRPAGSGGQPATVHQ